MTSPQKFFIAVDVDGTLLNTEFDDVLASREINALQAVRDAGHLLTLCTGRNLRSVEELLQASGWFPDDLPLVLLNGASVWGKEPRQCLASGVIGADVITSLIHLFREYGVVPMVYGTDDNGGILYHESRVVNDILGTYINKRRSAVGSILETDDLLELHLKQALEVGSIDVKEKVMALSDAIGREMPGLVKVINTRSLLGGGLYYWAEVFHASCDKGSGLNILREHYPDISGPLVAIGDNFNDLDMFEAADVSVAMAGSPAEVLNKADFVTKSVTEGGAALVLEQLAQGILPSNREVRP